ncbi:hypothetical protein LUZ61_012555 [Rhynchospora tenuis]|uniref:Endo-polygalacturonase n=1 Tax=Rhynchospora tenuis TaxID=198213 RepID=A0AAD6F1I9_9POAL|nr:hypothetical protein LUZ61_012555 [Rhynchospora tenuis]
MGSYMQFKWRYTNHVEGSIVAPEFGKWNNHSARKWLSFERIDSLVFTGSGSMDGSGSGLLLFISDGDDCISIGNGTSNVDIDGVSCGPGHGISIGSLGEDQSTATVEKISVSNSHFFNTTNGARIKTWQGGKGYVRSISYDNISFTNVTNPIIIDQYYCLTDNGCPPQKSAVQISNVKYNNFWGTSSKDYAVTLNCSKTVACTDIHLTNINITTVASSVGDTEATCINAYGEADGYLNTDMSCLHYSEIKD